MAYHLISELHAFAAAQLGPLQAVRFCGWPHAESSVWAVTGAEQAFLKVFRKPRKFVQERRAYRAWLPGLGFQGTPRLLAESSELRALLVSARPGSLLEHAHPSEAPGGVPASGRVVAGAARLTLCRRRPGALG